MKINIFQWQFFSNEEIFDDAGDVKTAVIAQKIAKEMQQVIEANQ